MRTRWFVVEAANQENDVTALITSSEISPSAAATIPLIITFNKAVTGFAVGDITVTGCTLSDFAGSGAVYTVTATPTAYTMTVDISAGVCVDAAGNGNTAATQFTMNCLVLWYLAGAVPAVNCKIAYKPIGAASYAASKVNLINPGTNDAVDGAAFPTWNSATGWTFDGLTSKILTTGWVPPNQVTRSAIVRISGAATDAANRFIFSSRNSGLIFGIKNTDTTSKATFYNGSGTQITHTTNVASGVLAIAGLDGYIDAVDVGNIAAGTYDMGSAGLEFGRITTGGQLFSGNILAFSGYDITPTPTQVSEISAAMALLT